MKPHRSSAVILAVIAFACTPPSPTHDQEADFSAINKVREQELTAFTGGQPDALAAVFTEDAVVSPPGEAQLNGREALRSWAQSIATQATVNGQYTGSSIQVAGDWAIERYSGSLTVTPKAGGPAVEEQLRGIHVYQRQTDGSWRIAHDIWNSGAPPAAK